MGFHEWANQSQTYSILKQAHPWDLAKSLEVITDSRWSLPGRTAGQEQQVHLGWIALQAELAPRVRHDPGPHASQAWVQGYPLQADNTCP